MAEINRKVTIAGAPEQVYAALTTLDGLRSWHTPRTAGSGHVGTEWQFTSTELPEIHWEIAASEANRKVEWWCTEGPGESVGTTVLFEISDLGGGNTLLEVAHDGWSGTDGEFNEWDTRWGVLIDRIRQYLESGTPAAAFD